jgi:hypothetical protein
VDVGRKPGYGPPPPDPYLRAELAALARRGRELVARRRALDAAW